MATLWLEAFVAGSATIVTLILSGYTGLATLRALRILAKPASQLAPELMLLQFTAVICMGLILQGSIFVIVAHALGSIRVFNWICMGSWIIGLSIMVAQREFVLQNLKTALKCHWPSILLGGVVGSLGIGAFPFAYDSAELGSIPALLGNPTEFPARSRGMAAYLGALLPIASALPMIQVAVVGAGVKLLIGLLLVLSASLTASAIEGPTYRGSRVLAFGVIFSSTLVCFGFIYLGKDSIVGILLLWIGLMAHSPRFSLSANHYVPIILTAAFSVGIIVLPYLLIVVMLHVLVSTSILKTIDGYSRIALFSIFTLAYALNLQSGLPIFAVASALALLYLTWRIVFPYLENSPCRTLSVSPVGEAILRYAPLILTALLMLNSPLSHSIDESFNYQWSSLRAPLGNTEFWQSLYGQKHVETTLSPAIGALGCLTLVLGPLFTRSKFTLIVMNLPFFVLAICYVHVIFDLEIIRYRLLWDLYKDIPQWMGGLYIAFAVVFLLGKLRITKPQSNTLVFVLFAWATIAPDAEALFPGYRQLWQATRDEQLLSKKDLLIQLSRFSDEKPTLHTVYLQRGLALGAQSLHNSLGYQARIYRDEKQLSELDEIESEIVVLSCARRGGELSSKQLKRIPELDIESRIARCLAYRKE